MTLDQLKPSKILRGPIFPEPVQVIVTLPMSEAVRRDVTYTDRCNDDVLHNSTFWFTA